MSSFLRHAAAVAAALSLAIGLTACGKTPGPGDPGGSASGTGGLKVGLLLVDNHTPRFEQFDRPLITKRTEELCDACTVEYRNAQGDVATQQQQVESVISQGADVLILDAVDAKALRSSVQQAHAAGIPVVAYDRIVEGPISGYVSFDAEQVGKLQGRALLEALRNRPDGDNQIVMMNGPQTHPESVSYRKGASSVLGDRVKTGKAYETAGWRPEHANTNMFGAIAALGADSIDGVYAANDGLASGVISALKAHGIDPLPPVTGQDAELAALQRIVRGEQYMTVYKPFKPEADAAAAMAVALGHGKTLDGISEEAVDTATHKEVPAVRLTPIPVAADTIEETVVKDGLYTLDESCTPRFMPDCEKAGLVE